MWANQPDLDLILDKKLLETITENQNSPYSTQASHNPSRRMSAQSLFDSTRRSENIQCRSCSLLNSLLNQLMQFIPGAVVATLEY